MTDNPLIFLSFCFGTLYLANVANKFLFPNPHKSLEAYGGCNSDDDYDAN
jgi:hypothetical protein